MPWLRDYGNKERSRRLIDKEALGELPKVKEALKKINEGGFPEGIIRMLILGNIVADNNIDRDQLMRLTEVITNEKPFNNLSSSELSEMIEVQTLIVRFAEDDSMDSLKSLIRTKAKRIEAYKLVLHVIGDKKEDLNPKTESMLNRIKQVLNLTDADLV